MIFSSCDGLGFRNDAVRVNIHGFDTLAFDDDFAAVAMVARYLFASLCVSRCA